MAARVFLDWNRPALAAVVEWLAERHTLGGVLDLSQLLLVLPGGRAGRRLLELLIDQATTDNVRLIPPRTTTAGYLPEQLYVSAKPFADDLTQRCAWVEALKATSPVELDHVRSRRPDDDDPRGWLELANLFQRQHRELAGDGLDFADVAECDLLEALPRERQRWETLRSIQQRYLEILQRLGLWDQQTARLVAIERDECESPDELILVGTVDINRALRRMFESPRVVDRITVLVHAPESLSDRFDSLGCLRPEAWRQPAVPVPDESVRIADRPDDQAATLATWLARQSEPLRADEITVGVADESLVPSVRRQLADSHVKARWVHEAALPETRPWILLEAVAACLSSWSEANPADDGDTGSRPTIGYEPLASLFRHPDVESWLRAGSGDAEEADPVVELDRYRAGHLISRLGPQPDETTPLQVSLRLVAELLAPLATAHRSLAGWSRPLVELLATVYRGRSADRDDRDGHVLLTAARRIHAAIDRLGEIPDAVALEVDAVEAIRLALESAARETIPALADPEAIEMVGWLELPLDDAPVLVVVGVNEGHVPASATSDLFLPDRLRQRLGILDNTRRIARDAYALSVLVASRDHLLLIGGRQTDSHSPLRPSRLLLATADDQAARVRRLLESPTAKRTLRLPGAFADGPETSQFLVPPPTDEGLDRVSVTAIHDFLVCRYRFYLRHVLRLRGFDDQPAELSPLSFGNLAHHVLEDFGQSDLTGSTDVDAIREFLQNAAGQQADRVHGLHRPEAVEVQLAQLSDRLDAFAAWQVRSIEDGWRIRYTEESIRGHIAVDTPAGQLSISGRIDRVDRHEQTGRWRVIDYKTGGTPESPEEKHRAGPKKAKTWIDLQLPLYRRLVREILDIDGDIELGFLVLPASVAQTNFLPAKWSPAELADADEVLDTAAEAIVRGEFDRIARRPPYSDDLWGICQDNLDQARHEHWSRS